MFSGTAAGPITNRANGGNDSFTKLLLHFNSTDTNVGFGDASASVHDVTANGNAQHDTAQFKFGVSSLLLDGTGDFLSFADHVDFDYASGDFTLDTWFMFNAIPGAAADQVIISQGDGTTNNDIKWIIRGDGSNQIHMVFSAVTGNVNRGTATSTTLQTVSTGVWYHAAIQRSGSNTFMHWNGVAQSVTQNNAWGTVADLANSVRIGQDSNGVANNVNGWLDEFRLSKGSARYGSGNFSTPTAEYD